MYPYEFRIEGQEIDEDLNLKYKVLCVRKVKVKEYRNRPGVAQRVPGDLGSQI